MKADVKNSIIGYSAGIITGITYGLNPLFAVPLMKNGASIEFILFFRYAFAVLLLGIFLLVRGQSFKVSWGQFWVLLLLGLLYASSSVFLFEAYNYIASGLATTLIFLYPVFVAIIMVFLGVAPSRQVWVAIFATFFGVAVMACENSSQSVNFTGVCLSMASAFVYAVFIVIINRSGVIKNISSYIITFYSLLVGVVIFFIKTAFSEMPAIGVIDICGFGNLLGLAIFPTIVSTATLAVSTRKIGATKASVLGVFEPITAIIVGTSVFGEVLSANIVAGISISIFAVVFMIISVSAKKDG